MSVRFAARAQDSNRPRPMIVIVAPVGDTWEFEEYLQQHGSPLQGRVRILTYDEIAARQELPLGTYVFVAIDQLSPTEKQIALQCCERLRQADPQLAIFNHPSEVLLRFPFLTACFEQNRNSFRVYRAGAFLRCRRFPVFLRRELDHLGNVSGLLYTPAQLARTIAECVLRGFRLRDLIVVEYCDTADPSSIFRKYSAFIVGNAILPHTLTHNRNWMTKSNGRLIDAGTVSEELEYLAGDPHAAWLRETFALARINYGRIDYGLLDGRPQVWEINTNPTISRAASADPRTEEQKQLRTLVRQHFHPRFQVAWGVVDSPADPNRTVSIKISERQRRRLAAEKQLRLRIQTRKTAVAAMARVLIRPLWRGAKRIGLVSTP
jgi:hypothetical protein